MNELTLNFNLLNDSNVEEYLIFQYLPDYNISIPIKTDYDVTNNIISTTINSNMGTFYLVDLTKWLNIFSESLSENSRELYFSNVSSSQNSQWK